MKKIRFILVLALTLAVLASSMATFHSGAAKATVYENGEFICGVPEKCTVFELRKVFNRPQSIFMNPDGNTFGDGGIFGTGYFLRYESNIGQTTFLTAVVIGDVNGDGLVTSADYLAIRAHMKGDLDLKVAFLRDISSFVEAANVVSEDGVTFAEKIRANQSKAFMMAADANGDGDLTSADYIKIKQYFLGGFDLYENVVKPIETPVYAPKSDGPFSPIWV